MLGGECSACFVTIGQFSIARLERGTQLLIPTFDYCIPTKSCPNVSGTSDENPCEVFSQIDFPMDAFFPARTIPASRPRKAAPRAAGWQANTRGSAARLPLTYRIPFCAAPRTSPTRARPTSCFCPASMRSCVLLGLRVFSAARMPASKRFASSAMADDIGKLQHYCRAGAWKQSACRRQILIELQRAHILLKVPRQRGSGTRQTVPDTSEDLRSADAPENVRSPIAQRA